MRRWSGDVAVVGAGTAGANVAARLARSGLSVLLLERRELDRGGAHWSNGVVEWQFDAAGVARPSGAERVRGGSRIHLRTLFDEPGVVVHDNPVVGVDMGALGDRLRAEAGAAGVEAVDRIGAIRLVERDGRARALEVGEGRAGSTLRVEASLFVDASGLRGALRTQSTILRPWSPPVRPSERCSAADVVFAVADREAARRQLGSWNAEPGEAVNVLGAAGGFSTRSVAVSEDLHEVRVLVGCVADGRHGPAQRLLTEVRRLHPWIGERLHGGAGLIPLRRPFSRFTAPGLASVGDAAAQVFPAHGSGVGTGLLAGSLLAETVKGASDPGDEQTLWRYQHEFFRRHGPDLAFYDGFRRYSSRIGGRGVREMLRSGMLTEHLAWCGLNQTRGSTLPSEVPGVLLGVGRAPQAGLRIVPSLVRCSAAASLAGRHPAGADLRVLGRWDRRLDRLIGG
ncbi:MAG: NAD(P)/FAD-dependent oxidoreductase [Acidimicrobiales bacterium]|nr:NAD(P)/FAD-dependent oxidoreductase [Acidimicrobiales bacterium]